MALLRIVLLVLGLLPMRDLAVVAINSPILKMHFENETENYTMTNNQKSYLKPAVTSLPVPVSGCTLKLHDKTFLNYLKIVDTRSKMVEFDISMRNMTPVGPAVDSFGNYKPYHWVRVNNEHGKTLLLFPFNYDILSLTMLKIGAPAFKLHLVDYPEMCFAGLSDLKRVELIREYLLTKLRTTNDFWFVQNLMVCNLIFDRHEGSATIEYNCCKKDEKDQTKCGLKLSDPWIEVLYTGLAIVKWLIVLFTPMLIPDTLYRVRFMVSEYIVKLENKLPLTIFVSEQDDASVRYRKRLTVSDISNWKRFRQIIEELPRDETLNMEIPELHLRVKTKRLLPENEAPTGLLQTIYDNLVRCKLRHIYPFTECCEESIFKPFRTSVEKQNKITWYICLRKCMTLWLLLFVIPIPYYARVVLYYFFEKKELDDRREALEHLDGTASLAFFRGSPMQYLSPTSPVFLVMYIVYFTASFMLVFARSRIRKRFKDVIQGSLRDMRNVSQLSSIAMGVRVVIWPFQRYGLLGFLIAPFYWLPILPITIILFLFYTIPTVYMSFRLLSYSVSKDRLDGDRRRSTLEDTLMKLRNEVITRFQAVRNREPPPPSPFSTTSFKSFVLPRCHSKYACIRQMFVQLTIGISSLTFLYGMTLLVMESAVFLVEITCFTLMGIIVNAGATIKYLTLIFLVVLYSHDCYSNVSKTYLEFNKAIVEDIMDRVDDLQKIACMPSSVQENFGFIVKPVDEEQKIQPMLNFDKRKPRWEIGHLLLFLDSFDTPRIPIRLFEQLCQVRVSGSPGPVYLSHVRATKKFLNIVLFLLFVMIVVKAFGEVYRMSATNQMMATLAGGFIPWLFKHVWSSNAQKMSLNTISFKGQVDELINGFVQNWPITDLALEPVAIVSTNTENNNIPNSLEKHKWASTNDILLSVPDFLPLHTRRNSIVLPPVETDSNKFILEKGGLKPLVKEQDQYRSKETISDAGDVVDLFIDLSPTDDELWWIRGSEESLPAIQTQSASTAGGSWRIETV